VLVEPPPLEELGFSATIHTAAITTVATRRAISGRETLLIESFFGR
jgi:hypothetical protein